MVERHLGRELTRTELIDGFLSTLLEPEDFDEVFNVSFTYVTAPTLQPKDDSSDSAVILTDILRAMCCVCYAFEILCPTDSLCQIHHSIVAFLCTLGLHYALIPALQIFTMFLLFQIKAHQKEHVKSTEGVLKDLLASQDKDMLQLLEEAAEQNKGEY